MENSNGFLVWGNIKRISFPLSTQFMSQNNPVKKLIVSLKKIRTERYRLKKKKTNIKMILLFVCVFAQQLSHVLLFATLGTVARQALLSQPSPAENTGLGCYDLLQGIFLTQGSKLCLLCLLCSLHCRWILTH